MKNSQLKLILTDSNNNPVKINVKSKRKHYKKPSYKKIDRVDKLDLNYLTLRRLYVEIANYCPRPLKLNGFIPEKIDVDGIITLWCTEYSRDDEYAIEQLPSVYYEAEINNSWNMKLFDKIRLHSELLDLLKEGIGFKDAVEAAYLRSDLSLSKQESRKTTKNFTDGAR